MFFVVTLLVGGTSVIFASSTVTSAAAVSATGPPAVVSFPAAVETASAVSDSPKATFLGRNPVADCLEGKATAGL